MAIAPPTPAPAIQSVPPEVSILTCANRLPAEVASFDKWRSGLKQRQAINVAGGTWDIDGGTSQDDKVEPTEEELSTFRPFIAYTTDGCDGRVDAEQYDAEAKAALEAQLAYRIGRELWTGTKSGNPSLMSQASDLSSGTPAPHIVCDTLIANYEDCTSGGQGFLHVPKNVIGQLFDRKYATRVGDRLVTPHGHVIIPGPGYPGNPGNWGPASASASAGQCFIYITGPVEVAWSEQFTTGSGIHPSGAFARQNKVRIYAEKYAIYRFPTNCVFGAKALITE